MSNVSKCFSCAHKNDYDPKFGYYGCNLSGQECKGYSMFEPKAKPKPVTNYERLIRKTPEELAEWIADKAANHGGGCCAPGCNDCSIHPDGCTQAWLDWLRKEIV